MILHINTCALTFARLPHRLPTPHTYIHWGGVLNSQIHLCHFLPLAMFTLSPPVTTVFRVFRHPSWIFSIRTPASICLIFFVYVAVQFFFSPPL